MDIPRFDHSLLLTPNKPGVYMMKNRQGSVLYVGKANNLKNRLKSYFRKSTNLPGKILRMLRSVHDFEFIVTDSESEALILECTLIKRYQPEFNARLKDGKSYPYIKIDLTEKFPQIYVTRNAPNDGSKYFGPFSSASSIRKTMALLKKLFPYRSCSKPITGTDPKPCLEYHINRCVAPCIGIVTEQQYHDVINNVIMFLEGDSGPVLKDIGTKMIDASNKQEFEKAAVLRDQLRSIRKVIEDQEKKVTSRQNVDMDIIAITENKHEAWVEIFFMRHGNLIGRDTYTMEGIEEKSGSTNSDFIKQFYQSSINIPPRILVEDTITEKHLIQQWLREKRGGPVHLSIPRGKTQRDLMDMVKENAIQSLKQRKSKWLSDYDSTYQAASELQESLSLEHMPRRIECYDISNIQGSNAVASLVVFENGVPKPSQYKRFKIKTVTGIDDYSMMQEVTRRRFTRLAKLLSESTKLENRVPPNKLTINNKGWDITPDLVLIDGGKGHLSAVLQILLELGLNFVPLASIAKEHEWIYVPQTPEPIILPKTSQGLYLLQRIRDEAHRFAITYHRNRRSSTINKSKLETVPGIGTKRKNSLLQRFGSLEGIREANIEEVTSIPNISYALAKKIKESLEHSLG